LSSEVLSGYSPFNKVLTVEWSSKKSMMAATPKPQPGKPVSQEMLVRLLTVAELLVSPEDEDENQNDAAERAKRESVSVALQKSRGDSADV